MALPDPEGVARLLRGAESSSLRVSDLAVSAARLEDLAHLAEVVRLSGATLSPETLLEAARRLRSIARAHDPADALDRSR